jgi:signal transduction histidine kinase
LKNLLDNAIKYTESGEIILRLKNSQNHLALEIQDSGIGISKEYEQRIYEPFSQASEGYTKEFQGVGLGLALTKRYLDIMDRHYLVSLISKGNDIVT